MHADVFPRRTTACILLGRRCRPDARRIDAGRYAVQHRKRKLWDCLALPLPFGYLHLHPVSLEICFLSPAFYNSGSKVPPSPLLAFLPHRSVAALPLGGGAVTADETRLLGDLGLTQVVTHLSPVSRPAPGRSLCAGTPHGLPLFVRGLRPASARSHAAGLPRAGVQHVVFARNLW